MRSAALCSIRCLATALTGSVIMAGLLPLCAAPDDPGPEKKPGLIHRLFRGDDKEKKEESKAPAPDAKRGAAKSKAKPSDEDKPAKTKSKASDEDKDKPAKAKSSTEDKPTKSKKVAEDEDKPSGRPKSKITLTVKGDGSPPGRLKPEHDEAATEKKAGPAKERDLGSEFGKNGEDSATKPAAKLDDRPRSAASSSPGVVENNVSLPPIDGSFEIVKFDGRDYVTVDSIHRFYRFSSMRIEGNQVILSNPTLILKAGLDSQEMLMNNIKFILSYPLTIVNGKPAFSRLDLCKLIDPVLLPSHITDADPFDTVVVDAGHGGHDSGARGVYGYEKDFALAMALSLRNALNQRGLKVVMTRSTDEFISLGGRAEIANATPHSIFVSLHFNSSGPAASGIETFALSPQGASSTFMGEHSSDYHSFSGNHQDSANIALATAVHAMVIHRFKLVDRGIKRARWSVLTGCNRPGILFEGGFVTNGTECRLIASTTYREAVANAIADAIVNYRRALQPRNMAQPSLRRVGP